MLLILVIAVGAYIANLTSAHSESVQLPQHANTSPPPLPSIASNNRISLPLVVKSSASEWPMVAANPQRTSWVNEEVRGNLGVEWYRPVEAYIPQNVQIIAANGLLYISTARGLYALNAVSGDVAWKFDTQLPLGNSPTIATVGNRSVAFVGGYDKKIHALDALTGIQIWEFSGANAGYSTNPLVANNTVYLGNRDGYFYAVNAATGGLVWQYPSAAQPPLGPIMLTAAMKDSTIFFAANDNYAYALNSVNGSLVWKSSKLPGDGYQSYWPVVYRDPHTGKDYVIYTTASGYRQNADPGSRGVNCTSSWQTNSDGSKYYGPCESQQDLIWDGIFWNIPAGQFFGPLATPPDSAWAHGHQIIDASKVSEFFENNPTPDTHLHKPWRRTYVILDATNGTEYTQDVDHDGYPDYAPIPWWGTRNGNFQYPPAVGNDGILYQDVAYISTSIPQGIMMGWKMGTAYLSMIGIQGAWDEPSAYSIGGNTIYRVLCCERSGSLIGIADSTYQSVWGDLGKLAPGYNDMWWAGTSRGSFYGNFGTRNGIYNSHGDQNPMIPYGGRIYVHQANAIIAFGPNTPRGKLPLLTYNRQTSDAIRIPTVDVLKQRLEDQVRKIIAAGDLRPGYYNDGNFYFQNMDSYFDNPGDTLYTLAQAYPYLSPGLQTQVKTYLQNQYATYFYPVTYARKGWAEGAARESMPLPNDLAQALATKLKDGCNNPWTTYQKTTCLSHQGDGWPWSYPQYNFYALWKYAQLVPQDVQTAYGVAKANLEVPATASNSRLSEHPWEHNGYIAGYIGFLRLQELAGKVTVDGALRSQVTNELNRLLSLRSSTFSKDTPWVDPNNPNLPPSDLGALKRSMNISRNFIMLVPELGDYLNQNALSKVRDAVSEYNYVAPYWLATRYEATVGEGVRQNLYDSPALFQAKAYILKEPYNELVKYLDVPAFERGDLFYIQNLVAALSAP